MVFAIQHLIENQADAIPMVLPTKTNTLRYNTVIYLRDEHTFHNHF